MPRFTLINPTGSPQVVYAEESVIRFGRGWDESYPNDVQIDHPTVSRHHAEIVRDGELTVLRSRGPNGTYVGDRLVRESAELGPREELRFGECPTVVVYEDVDALGGDAEPLEVTNLMSGPYITDPFRLHQLMHGALLERLELDSSDLDEIDPEFLAHRVRDRVKQVIEEFGRRIPPAVDRHKLARDLYNHTMGLGPIQELLEEPSITEVMVNGPDKIYIERGGKIERCDARFLSDEQVLTVIRRIIAPLGRRIDESTPMVDGRLPDGSRVNAIIPPLALCGPTITVRKFPERRFEFDDLEERDSLIPAMREFLILAVKASQNIIVSGGTGSGKTTLLNVLGSAIPEDERIITIEDAAELQLPQEHWVSLECRPPNTEDKGAVTPRDLLKNALRMNPTRIVVGEVRDGTALDMLNAMNTGHDGSLTTVHANNPQELIARLETLVLQSGIELPVRAIHGLIAAAVNVIVQVAKLRDGSRRVINISEIEREGASDFTVRKIFEFKETGRSATGKIEGTFTGCGVVPRFVEELRARGQAIDDAMFAVQAGGSQ